MSTFVLVPGAGGAAWYWHRVVPKLRAHGHHTVAVDLPGPDETAGLPEYADAIVAAAGSERDVVIVAQSMGGFSAPMACERIDARLLVLVNAMVPLPGETPGAWWANTGAQEARVAAAEAGGYPTEFDVATYFLHDVPAAILADGAAQERPEADIAFSQPCGIERWPAAPTRALAGADDRFFPLMFQRRVVRDRLGLDLTDLPGGHLVALSNPIQLADQLAAALD